MRRSLPTYLFLSFTSSVELPPNIKQLQPTFLRLGDLGRVNRLNIVERT